MRERYITMTITHGANVQQLADLGTRLNQQIESINQIMTTVDGAINGTAWAGPARERFVEDWNVQFKGALGKLNEAFGLAGKDCTARSEQLRQLMGIG
jgi:hypothetical protein